MAVTIEDFLAGGKYHDIENTELYNWNVHLRPGKKQ